MGVQAVVLTNNPQQLKYAKYIRVKGARAQPRTPAMFPSSQKQEGNNPHEGMLFLPDSRVVVIRFLRKWLSLLVLGLGQFPV